MRAITPFHCWTEYWKAKEILNLTWREACVKESEFLKTETHELNDRIEEWEVRHSPSSPPESDEECMSAVLKIYPHAIIALEGAGWVVSYPENGWQPIGASWTAGGAWRDAYKNLKEKGKI